MTRHNKKLPIIITPGEPAGVGPDIIITLAQQKIDYPVIIIADPDLLSARAKQLNLPLNINLIKSIAEDAVHTENHRLNIYPIKLTKTIKAGELSIENVPYVLKTIRTAVNFCLKNQAAAMVTGPINKAIINQAGVPFTGHTHYLATLANVSDVVMLLAAKQLRVALVTDHIPVQKISMMITAERLEKTLRILNQGLIKLFNIKHPRINVCGLNPHAGEGGYLGNEEQEVINPILEKLRKEGMELIGPLSADTAFIPEALNNIDAVLAMYHDQGLPVLKYAGFGHAVNITLGLPFIRTSVDHGTALALAGTGKADPASLRQALQTAIELSHASSA